MMEKFPKQCRLKCHVLFYSRLNNFPTKELSLSCLYIYVCGKEQKKIVKLTRKIMQINHSFAHPTNVAKFAECNF